MRLAQTLSNLAIVRASARKRLWLFAGGIAAFIATVWTCHALFPPRGPKNPGFGLDFIAFYTAGDFVRLGRTAQLYDLSVVHQFQLHLAALNHFDIGHAYGPWWNPPFYALLFSPLSRLSYPTASAVWIGINLLCFALACVLLCRWLPRGMSWKSRALAPALVILSAPFILAVSHAQNTCTSLLLLTAVATLWQAAGDRRGTGQSLEEGERREPRSSEQTPPARPGEDTDPLDPRGKTFIRKHIAFFAGLVGGLMFYKPQVASVVALVLVLDLGWPALAGYAVTGMGLLLSNLILLPGTLVDYLHRLPLNVHSFQTGTLYPWEEHVTLKAFWRLLLQGDALGDATPLVVILSIVTAGVVGVLLLRAAVLMRHRTGPIRIRRARLIAATIAATPLLMPFYFDYDLLLLAVPAMLFAAELVRRQTPLPRVDRWLIASWVAVYCWQMINTDVAAAIHLNLAVPLLSILALMLIARVTRRPSSAAAHGAAFRFPLPKAA